MNKIIDEAYFDLLVPHGAETDLTDLVIVNRTDSIRFVPADTITKCSTEEYDYSRFPLLYSPLSITSLESSTITNVRNIPNLALFGKGVLVGIIDTGIDYQHEAFKNDDGTTRIVSIWDQTINNTQNPPEGFTYGIEYTAEMINNALRSTNPISIVPSTDEMGHGTMIAGVAAGNMNIANNFSGVASKAGLVVVKLKQAKNNLKDFFAVRPDVTCFQETDIMLALRYVTSVAQSLNMPIAVCLALGTSQGGHDGRGSLCQYCFDLSTQIGIAICVGAGNESNLSRHYYKELDPSINENTFELNVGKDEVSFGLEIWSGVPSRLSVSITSPTGETMPPVMPSLADCRMKNLVFESSTIWVSNIPIESSSGDQVILIRLQRPTEGIWRITTYNNESLARVINAWLPQEDLITNKTYFLEPNPNTTITSPGNGAYTMTVGAYNSLDKSIYINSGRGYSRTNAILPDFVAPGVNIVCPIPNNAYTTATGTGVAAAHTMGAVALLLEWGIVRGNQPTLNGIGVSKIIIRGARREPNIIYPNNIYGFGELDLYTAFERLR